MSGALMKWMSICVPDTTCCCPCTNVSGMQFKAPPHMIIKGMWGLPDLTCFHETCTGFTLCLSFLCVLTAWSVCLDMRLSLLVAPPFWFVCFKLRKYVHIFLSYLFREIFLTSLFKKCGPTKSQAIVWNRTPFGFNSNVVKTSFLLFWRVR